MEAAHDRRFAGVARLYGAAAAARLARARVCVIGVGGVGSWALEALARTGVGQLAAVDLDMVAESNTNRQIHALGDIYGMAKVDAMAARIRAINPACTVTCVEDFVTPENVAEILEPGFDVVIDAIDQARAKGYLGRDVLGKGANFDLVVHLGARQHDPGPDDARHFARKRG